MKLKSTLVAACVALAFGPIAHADDEERFAFTLDITEADNEAGARAVYAAITHEANRLCAARERRAWLGRSAVLECRRDVTDQVVAQVNMPLVTAAHTNGAGPRAFADVDR